MTVCWLAAMSSSAVRLMSGFNFICWRKEVLGVEGVEGLAEGLAEVLALLLEEDEEEEERFLDMVRGILE